MTQFDLADGTAGLQGAGAPRALILVLEGGRISEWTRHLHGRYQSARGRDALVARERHR